MSIPMRAVVRDSFTVETSVAIGNAIGQRRMMKDKRSKDWYGNFTYQYSYDSGGGARADIFRCHRSNRLIQITDYNWTK